MFCWQSDIIGKDYKMFTQIILPAARPVDDKIIGKILVCDFALALALSYCYFALVHCILLSLFLWYGHKFWILVAVAVNI